MINLKIKAGRYYTGDIGRNAFVNEDIIGVVLDKIEFTRTKYQYDEETIVTETFYLVRKDNGVVRTVKANEIHQVIDSISVI